jgi:REP element-mobilizing transposase RayT
VGRPTRLEIEGGIHHVTARGDHKRLVLEHEADQRSFLRRYGEVVERHGWVPLSYCLMTNHVHLVVETPRRTLGLGARDLLSDFAKRHNERRGERGHVFQGRFHSRLVLSDAYFAQLLRYVALNPVAAGACAAAEAWRWSSHAALLAGREDRLVAAGRVDELLSGSGVSSGARYASLFEAAHPLALKYGSADPGTWRPSLDTLFEGGSRAQGAAAAREHGYRLADIAVHVGVHESTVSRWLRASAGARRKKGA